MVIRLESNRVRMLARGAGWPRRSKSTEVVAAWGFPHLRVGGQELRAPGCLEQEETTSAAPVPHSGFGTPMDGSANPLCLLVPWWTDLARLGNSQV